MRYKKILLSFLLISLFLCTSFVSSYADSGSVHDQDLISFSEEGQIDHAKMISVPFPGVDEKTSEWKFPYSDGFFSIPSGEFSITTARGSMGLTVSAFRGTKGSGSLQYKTYLGNAGFTNIYAFGYIAGRHLRTDQSQIEENGRLHYPENDDPDSQTRIPEAFMMRNENETVVSLPGDEEYYVVMDTDSPGTVSLYGLINTPKILASEADKINLYRMAAYRLVRNVVVGLIIFLLACLISNLYHRYKVKNGHPPYSKWFIITPYLVSAFGFAVLAVLLSYHLFAIDKARIISASFSVLAIFLLSLRGTIRYRRRSSGDDIPQSGQYDMG